MLELRSLIRDVRDFPKAGIVFKDITPLLASPAGLAMAIEVLANPFRGRGVQVVVGAESRGFIFGTALAQTLSCGFVPVRKPGKLPAEKVSLTYELEYGTDTLEMHRDAIGRGKKCLMVDDLLATGGTMKACCDMVESLGGEICGIAVLIELAFLKGRLRFGKYELHSAIQYDGE
ncbi:MAG: adenine phosphoribosyltransferase [Phycisphaerales bacterium]|nr:adenine phosphoribosyltransferase [Phycisphaerales bacterium]